MPLVIAMKIISDMANLKLDIFNMRFLKKIIQIQFDNKFYIYNFDSAAIFGFLDGEKVLKLQLDHIYTSFWFLFTLILLCISLAACSFRRQIPSLKASLKWIEYKSEKKN